MFGFLPVFFFFFGIGVFLAIVYLVLIKGPIFLLWAVRELAEVPVIWYRAFMKGWNEANDAKSNHEN